MSSTDNTEPKVEETKPAEAAPVEATTATEEAKPSVTSSSVFSMFGGGAKKEKKDEDEDRGDNSGSAKAQREAAAAAKGDDEVRLDLQWPFLPWTSSNFLSLSAPPFFIYPLCLRKTCAN